MHAIICAAGEGKRMRPHTENFPKALLKIGDKTIIEYMLDNLSACGVRDVVIVVGYKADTVREKIGSYYRNCRVSYVMNNEYETTNNIYSLWLARDYVRDGMIFFNGDIVFHRGILSGILTNDARNSFAVDPHVELEDDAMKVILQSGRLRKIRKHLGEDANAWAIGMYKLSQEASEAYFHEAEKLFEAGQKNISFVVPLQALAGKFSFKKHKVLPQYGWAEIDTPLDYEKAQERANSIIVGQDDEGGNVFSNHEELTTSSSRRKLLQWAHEGIQGALPLHFMRRSVSFEDGVLSVKDQKIPIKGKRVFVIGAGKASGAMAVELEHILGAGNITAGVVLTNDVEDRPRKIELVETDHPVPSERSVEGARKILALKEKFKINENDIIIALVSGGGSSLMAYPAEGISLKDKQKTIEALIASGGNVHEITIVKKKISRIKGGKLGRHFYPTPIVSLVLSDVVGNNLDVISSGPFAEDRSTVADTLSIIHKRKIEGKIPEAVLDFLEKHKDEETGCGGFDHVQHEILADNNTVLETIESLAKNEGLDVIVEPHIQGEAREVAYVLCSDIHAKKITRPTLFLYGGETTVTLDYPHKKGGRNQEFVLACLQYMQARPFHGDWCIASVGTDGIDFVEDSAGGIIDNNSLQVAKEKGLMPAISSFLENHKTGRFLSEINSNIHVGKPTGTNVGDIIMFYLTP